MGLVSGRRGATLLLLGAVAVAALVSAGEDNRDGFRGYMDVRDTECWTCHASWDPPLRELFHLFPPTGIQADVGEVFDYPLRVQDGYLSDLVRIEASINVENAPSLAFVGGLPPILDEAIGGVIEFNGLPTADQTGTVGIRVDPGVTDMTIRLRPENTDPTLGPDLTLNVYPAQEGTQGIPAFSIDEAGSGAEEAFQIVGASEIAELGFGNWTIEAAMTPVSAGGFDPTGFGNPRFAIVVDQYFNASDSTLSFIGKDVTIKPDQSEIFSWELTAVARPEPGETITVAVNATSFYNHDSSANPDYGWAHRSVVVPVAATPTGGLNFDLGDTEVLLVAGGIDQGVSMSRIAEIIGYISAFLVLASIYTGGFFGKTSRRQLNKLFASAKRRVAYHNFLSYGIILAATVHMVIFLWPLPNIEGNYHWTVGLIWGTLSTLCMFGLGFTGALQVPIIRRWNYAAWKWTHWSLSIGTILFTIVHILLDGGNTGEIQSWVGWEDPLDMRDI